ncbi:MAG: NAD(P)(+) transhydrogenase (Re/Si-specific) subunit beta [Polyangiales bacterium]
MDHAPASSGTVLLIQLSYLLAVALFVFGLKAMASPKTARRGMFMAETGMALAVIGTLLDARVISYEWIAVGIVVGTAAGCVIAIWTPMTHMPQRTALSHAFGALAAALVGVAEFYDFAHELGVVERTALGLEVMLGSLTLTGSLLAFGKLQEWLPGSPVSYPGQNVVSIGLLLSILGLTVYVIIDPSAGWAFYTMVGLALLFGVALVLPIGAADMPVVIALLNAYAGLAGSATGFALDNNILIVAGALDGASGLILSILMCKAMNRSITNVLFGRIEVGATTAKADDVYAGKIKSSQPDELAMVLEDVQRVVIVPGYGMAVSQAQHAVRDLFRLLESRGATVEFAIHPVAGRMPGHMNVLLAEADIPYDRLIEMDSINPTFDTVDVAIVIGANDVVNPDARKSDSPIAGMPILDVDKARTVAVIKRSLAPGFAGIPNPLFAMDNTVMCFGDGTEFLKNLIAAMKEQH